MVIDILGVAGGIEEFGLGLGVGREEGGPGVHFLLRAERRGENRYPSRDALENRVPAAMGQKRACGRVIEDAHLRHARAHRHAPPLGTLLKPCHTRTIQELMLKKQFLALDSVYSPRNEGHREQ